MGAERGSDILAYTVSYGDRGHLSELVPQMRGTAHLWFDWAVYLGNPSASLLGDAQRLLRDPERQGIQYLQHWPENRGQHHATAGALKMAREKGYKWLLRIDDDVQAKTKRWLKKMVYRLEKLKEIKDDQYYRIVAAPRIIGLRNALQPEGHIDIGQKFPAEVMGILGGACRLHPVELLEQYEPPLYAPKGRGDPDSMAHYIASNLALMVRFPDIRIVHRTNELEALDSPEQSLMRKMSFYYPFLSEAF